MINKFANCRVVLQLTLAQLRFYSSRLMLTVWAIVASVCMVVWVVSGYDSLTKKFDEFSDEYMGSYDYLIVPYTAGQEGRGTGALNNPALNNRRDNTPVRFKSSITDTIRQDPAVSRLDCILQIHANFSKLNAPIESVGITSSTTVDQTTKRDDAARIDLQNNGGTVRGMNTGSRNGRSVNLPPMLVGTTATQPPYSLLEGRWIDPQNVKSQDAVISREFASQLKVTVGDQVEAKLSGSKSLLLTVVGIIEQRKGLPPSPQLPGTHAPRGSPLPRGPAVEAIYVTYELASEFGNVDGQCDLFGIVLSPNSDSSAFLKRWAEYLHAQEPIGQLQSLAEIEQELNESVASETVRGQAWMATGLALLSALFIIFATLSMGVEERINQLSLLRAVAFSKSQVAAMIVLEGLVLAIMGWLGGLLAGWGLLTFIKYLRPELVPLGMSLGTWCITLSGFCSVGGALVASILPAWRATRVSPLEVTSSQAINSNSGVPLLVSVSGIVLVIINPLILFTIPISDNARMLAASCLGFPAMGLGFVLLSPITVVVTERALLAVVCLLLRIDRRLLATQLTSNLWRTLSTTVALSLGLGLYIAMQTWGYSMLAPFVPGAWVPDSIVMMNPIGLPFEAAQTIRDIPGVDGVRSLACIAEQTKFSTDVTGAIDRATTARQDNCIVLGVEAELALGGNKPVFDFVFIRGDRLSALSKLKQGRYCLVPDSFERESGLTVGNKFGVHPPNHPGQIVEYEIAGVVSMPGWHWMSKVGLRNREGGRSAAMMVASIEQVEQDMDVHRLNAFWLNYLPGANEADIKYAIENIVERNFDPSLVAKRSAHSAVGRNHPTTGGQPGTTSNQLGSIEVREGFSTSVAIRSREEVRESITKRAKDVIWLICQLPIVTLLVTSIGVVNTIVASVRVRQWDLGILRALGITRFGLIRLILGEAVMMGLAACVLSVLFGVAAGYCGTEISRYLNMRGGQVTSLVIPWLPIAWGCALALLLCLLAASWPALKAGLAEPLKLLMGGKARH